MVERGRGGGGVPPYCEANLRQTTPTSTDAQACTTTTTTTMTLSTRGKNNFFLLHILFNNDFGVALPRVCACTWPSHPQHPLDFNPPPCPPSHAWHNQTATAPPRKWLRSGSTPPDPPISATGSPSFSSLSSVPSYSFLVAFESSVPSPPTTTTTAIHPTHLPTPPSSAHLPQNFCFPAPFPPPPMTMTTTMDKATTTDAESSCFVFFIIRIINNIFIFWGVKT